MWLLELLVGLIEAFCAPRSRQVGGYRRRDGRWVRTYWRR